MASQTSFCTLESGEQKQLINHDSATTNALISIIQLISFPESARNCRMRLCQHFSPPAVSITANPRLINHNPC